MSNSKKSERKRLKKLKKKRAKEKKKLQQELFQEDIHSQRSNMRNPHSRTVYRNTCDVCDKVITGGRFCSLQHYEEFQADPGKFQVVASEISDHQRYLERMGAVKPRRSHRVGSEEELNAARVVNVDGNVWDQAESNQELADWDVYMQAQLKSGTITQEEYNEIQEDIKKKEQEIQAFGTGLVASRRAENIYEEMPSGDHEPLQTDAFNSLSETERAYADNLIEFAAVQRAKIRERLENHRVAAKKPIASLIAKIWPHSTNWKHDPKYIYHEIPTP